VERLAVACLQLDGINGPKHEKAPPKEINTEKRIVKEQRDGGGGHGIISKR